MKTRDHWNEISLIAILAIGCAGCAIHAGTQGTGRDGGVRVIGSDGGIATVTCTLALPPPTPGPGMTKAPCDIYAEDGGPCVAAHSTVRALYGGYNGPLYQVKKSDGSTMDIGVLEAGGFANAAAQDTFCGTGACTISKIYDQSGWANDLTRGPPSMIKPTETNESNAKALPVMFGSNKAYGVRIVPGGGYRNNGACGTATGD